MKWKIALMVLMLAASAAALTPSTPKTEFNAAPGRILAIPITLVTDQPMQVDIELNGDLAPLAVLNQTSVITSESYGAWLGRATAYVSLPSQLPLGLPHTLRVLFREHAISEKAEGLGAAFIAVQAITFSFNIVGALKEDTDVSYKSMLRDSMPATFREPTQAALDSILKQARAAAAVPLVPTANVTVMPTAAPTVQIVTITPSAVTYAPTPPPKGDNTLLYAGVAALLIVIILAVWWSRRGRTGYRYAPY